MSNFKQQLWKAKTMEEFLNTCSEHYDFKNCKLNSIQLGSLIGNIDKVITVSGAKPKK